MTSLDQKPTTHKKRRRRKGKVLGEISSGESSSIALLDSRHVSDDHNGGAVSNAAGPSSQSSSRASPIPLGIPPAMASASSQDGPRVTPGGFATDVDFIPFDFSDDEKEEEDVTPVVSPGKGKGRDLSDRGGQIGAKRPAELMEEDGYANKRQRTDAISRLTPWIDSVKWDDCRNLAELYVCSYDVCMC